MAAAWLGAAERVKISRQSQLRWLTELQAAVYQLQLQLSGGRKRRVTLTAAEFLTTLSAQVQGSPIKQLRFSQGVFESGGGGRGKVQLCSGASCCGGLHLTSETALTNEKNKSIYKKNQNKPNESNCFRCMISAICFNFRKTETKSPSIKGRTQFRTLDSSLPRV